MYNVWARIVSEGNRCYASWLNDAMAARNGRYDPCTNRQDPCTNALKYE